MIEHLARLDVGDIEIGRRLRIFFLQALERDGNRQLSERMRRNHDHFGAFFRPPQSERERQCGFPHAALAAENNQPGIGGWGAHADLRAEVA